MRASAFLLSLLLPLPLVATVVHAADGAAPIPAPEHRTLEEFGRTDTACREWDDGCAVCRRAGEGSVACSLPGIACEPGVPVCKDRVKAGETTNGEPPPY